MKILPQIAQDTSSTRLSPRKSHEESKYGTAGVRSGTSCCNQADFTGMSNPIRDKFITQQTEVNIRSDCTIDEQVTKYSNGR
jgi:hypothetical protein